MNFSDLHLSLSVICLLSVLRLTDPDYVPTGISIIDDWDGIKLILLIVGILELLRYMIEKSKEADING